MRPENAGRPPNYVAVGLLATLCVVMLALALSSPFDSHTYTSWVAFVWITAVPAQIVFGLQWHFEHPAWVRRVAQPGRGLLFLALTIPGMVCGGAFLFYVPGHAAGPTPMLIMATIMSVVAAFWVVVVWRGWPLSAFIQSPVALGIAAWVLSYALGYVLFVLCFDFSFASDAPFYIAAVDPGGAFNAWSALIYFVTTSAVIVVARMFDFWPIGRLPGGHGPKGFAAYATVYVLVISAILMAVFTWAFRYDPVDYMVRVPVSMIFGVLLVTNMMQFQLFRAGTQPQKGLKLLALTVVVAIVAQAFYSEAGPVLSGEPLPIGGPAYKRELWVATALLAVTFPLIILVSGYFSFWPFRRTRTDHV
jgi:hypothetical protein